MRAYDESGGLLASVQSRSPSGTFKGTLALEDVGEIRSVVWLSNQPFVAAIEIDNLTFEVVPEPASLALRAIGLAGIAQSRRRARRTAGPDT